MKKSLDKDELFKQANKYWEEERLDEALNTFILAAENGNYNAYLNIGYFFDEGLVCKRDIDKALFWYKKAADLQDCAAMENIALIYKELGDIESAKIWLKQAIAGNDGDASLELAKIFFSSNNLEETKKYLDIALASSSITKESEEEAKNFFQKLKE